MSEHFVELLSEFNTLSDSLFAPHVASFVKTNNVAVIGSIAVSVVMILLGFIFTIKKFSTRKQVEEEEEEEESTPEETVTETTVTTTTTYTDTEIVEQTTVKETTTSTNTEFINSVLSPKSSPSVQRYQNRLTSPLKTSLTSPLRTQFLSPIKTPLLEEIIESGEQLVESPIEEATPVSNEAALTPEVKRDEPIVDVIDNAEEEIQEEEEEQVETVTVETTQKVSVKPKKEKSKESEPQKVTVETVQKIVVKSPRSKKTVSSPAVRRQSSRLSIAPERFGFETDSINERSRRTSSVYSSPAKSPRTKSPRRKSTLSGKIDLDD